MKVAGLAFVLAACGGGSPASEGDDTPGEPDASLPADPSARTWKFAPFANGMRPKYAVSPAGTFAVAMNDDLAVIKIAFSDGTSLGSPNGPQANHEGVYGIAYDKDSSLHLFFRVWGQTMTLQHWVYRASAWQQLPALTTQGKLVVANGPHGELYGLLSELSGTEAYLSFLTFNADDTVTTEAIDHIHESDPVTFTIGRDGNPAIAWGTSNGAGFPQYLHRGSTGWTKTQLGSERFQLPRISIAAGDLATVFIGTTDTRYLAQLTPTTWTTPAPAMDIGPFVATTTDSYGIIHTCTADRHGQLKQGALAVTKLDEGGYDCWLGTDAAGRLYLAYHNGNVIKRGVFD